MKKILFVTHAAHYGGAELFLRDIVVHARQGGHHWPVIFLDDGPLIQDLVAAGSKARTVKAGAQILKLKRGSSLRDVVSALMGIVAAVGALVREFRGVDIVCANSQKSLFVAGLAARLARKPFVWILHDLVTDKSFSPTMRRALVFFANHMTARVVANSIAAREALIQCGGRGDTISVVYNGFDFTADFSGSGADRGLVLQEAGLPDRPTVGVFGRIAAWKGQHVLIEAVDRIPGLQAIIVGDATYQDSGYFDHLRALVDQKHLSDRVKFLGFRKDVQRLMAAVDIIAHTSIDPEPFGRVIVEGLALGRPVVATRGGGVGEIIDHGKTGLLYPPGDSAALTEALHALISDPAKASRFGAEGRSAVMARFSIQRSVQDLDRLFETL